MMVKQEKSHVLATVAVYSHIADDDGTAGKVEQCFLQLEDCSRRDLTAVRASPATKQKGWL